MSAHLAFLEPSQQFRKTFCHTKRIQSTGSILSHKLLILPSLSVVIRNQSHQKFSRRCSDIFSVSLIASRKRIDQTLAVDRNRVDVVHATTWASDWISNLSMTHSTILEFSPILMLAIVGDMQRSQAHSSLNSIPPTPCNCCLLLAQHSNEHRLLVYDNVQGECFQVRMLFNKCIVPVKG